MPRSLLLSALVLAAAFACGCVTSVEGGGTADEETVDDWCLNQDDGAYCPVCDLKGACQGGACVQVQLGPPHCD